MDIKHPFDSKINKTVTPIYKVCATVDCLVHNIEIKRDAAQESA